MISPTPWNVEKIPGEDNYIYKIKAANGAFLAEVTRDYNAEYVVEAVNNYETQKKRIAELEDVLDRIMLYSAPDDRHESDYRKYYHTAEQLLKEVRDERTNS